jgi:hypothetical protein
VDTAKSGTTRENGVGAQHKSATLPGVNALITFGVVNALGFCINYWAGGFGLLAVVAVGYFAYLVGTVVEVRRSR